VVLNGQPSVISLEFISNMYQLSNFDFV